MCFDNTELHQGRCCTTTFYIPFNNAATSAGRAGGADEPLLTHNLSLAPVPAAAGQHQHHGWACWRDRRHHHFASTSSGAGTLALNNAAGQPPFNAGTERAGRHCCFRTGSGAVLAAASCQTSTNIAAGHESL
jgi:hypothetical protein